MSSNSWSTASDRRKRGKVAREMRNGRLVAAPGPAVPAGTRHAYQRDGDTTACGLSVSRLVRWPYKPFLRGVLPSHRCRDCTAIVRGASG